MWDGHSNSPWVKPMGWAVLGDQACALKLDLQSMPLGDLPLGTGNGICMDMLGLCWQRCKELLTSPAAETVLAAACLDFWQAGFNVHGVFGWSTLGNASVISLTRATFLRRDLVHPQRRRLVTKDRDCCRHSGWIPQSVPASCAENQTCERPLFGDISMCSSINILGITGSDQLWSARTAFVHSFQMVLETLPIMPSGTCIWTFCRPKTWLVAKRIYGIGHHTPNYVTRDAFLVKFMIIPVNMDDYIDTIIITIRL